MDYYLSTGNMPPVHGVPIPVSSKLQSKLH
jgi:hypothetical protein